MRKLREVVLVNKKGVDFDVHQRARQMLEDGYAGQNMKGWDSVDVLDRIYTAAADPYVEFNMRTSTYGMWWFINMKYEAWLARLDLDRTNSKWRAAS